MPESDRTADAFPSDELLLAAIDRANCHRGRPEEPGVLLANVKAHLDLPHHSGTTRRLRPQLTALEADGLINQQSRRRHVVWSLTSRGRQRLEAARQAGKLNSLPESPQHRYWREARAAADERIGEFRAHLRGAMDEAMSLLDTNEQIPSAAWFELSERLQNATWLLASAAYCLHEWAEPDDSKADLDEPPYGQHGRRHTRGWNRD